MINSYDYLLNLIRKLEKNQDQKELVKELKIVLSLMLQERGGYK